MTHSRQRDNLPFTLYRSKTLGLLRRTCIDGISRTTSNKKGIPRNPLLYDEQYVYTRM